MMTLHVINRKDRENFCPFCECTAKNATREQIAYKLKKKDYDLLEFTSLKENAKIIHKCGNIKNCNLIHILNRSTSCCEKCSHGSIAYKPEYVKKEINDLTNGEYTVLSNYQRENIKILIKHEICGNEFYMIRRNFVYNNCRCPKCNKLRTSSKGEKKITEILTKLNISFEKEKTFKECKNKRVLPFDFYIKDKNLLIEFDGEMHFHPMRFKEDCIKKLNETHDNDLMKNEFCIKNKINLLRIPYTINLGSINKVLTEVLKNGNISSTTIEKYKLYYNENIHYYDDLYKVE